MAGKKVEIFDLGIYYPVSITDGNSSSVSTMAPLSSGVVYAYDPNTTSDQTVYSDVSLSTPLSQPFTLDSNGRKEVFVANSIVKFVIKDSTDTTTIRTIDYVDGQRDTFEDNITFNGTVTFGTAFGFSDGTVSSPGIQFSSDSNTGLRRIGADNFSLVAGGVDIIDIDGSGMEMKKRIETIAGTAAAPSSVSVSDTDTGPFYPGTDQYGISCGGTLIGEFTTSALVMDYPIYLDDGSVSAPALTFESDTDSGIYHSGTANIYRFAANGVEQMEINTSGVNFPNGGDLGDTGTYLKTRVESIGDWNMDSTASVTVAHNITASKIRSVSATIRNDAADTFYQLSNSDTADGYVASWDSTDVTLTRTGSGAYDNTSFDATSYNRGYVYIVYEA